MSGTLYVVATPIGHLDDMTGRAVDVLKSVETIAVEDSRRAGILLNHIGITQRRMVTLHDHNEQSVTAGLVDRLRDGSDIALISDAGTPLLSDPGFDLVRGARVANAPVVPVPGASAITAALCVCPIPSRRFFFEGFLPAKAEARRQRLDQLAVIGETVVFFEAPHRILHCLTDMVAAAGGERLVFLGREMTKRHEEYLFGTVTEVLEKLAGRAQIKGEFVGVIAASLGEASDSEVNRIMGVLSQELGPSVAAKLGAKLTGASRSELYELARRLASRTAR